MKEITSKDIFWEVVKWNADLENCDWLSLMEPRWLLSTAWALALQWLAGWCPSASVAPQASVLIWVTLRYAGVDCSLAHAPGPSPALTHVYGSPLEWPLERNLVSSVIGMLGIRLKDRVTGCIAFLSRWMWNLCTGSICCWFLQPEIMGTRD